MDIENNVELWYNSVSNNVRRLHMANNDFIIENVLVAFVDTSALDPMFNDYTVL